MDEKQMNMSWGLELMLGERLAERRREAERDRLARLARSGRGSGRARRGAEFSTDRGPRS